MRGGSGLGEAYFDGISLALGRTGDGFSYAVSAQAHSPYWDSFYFNGTGSASSDERSLKFPGTVLKFSGKENGYSFSGSLKALCGERAFGGGHFACHALVVFHRHAQGASEGFEHGFGLVVSVFAAQIVNV